MKEQSNNGWVRLHRKIFENELWFSEPFTKAQAWVDLFAGANHTNSSFWVRGIEVRVNRGQLGWSELTMAKRWCWSKNKVRRFLKWLETKQQIEQQKTFVTTLITIKNYDKYQEIEQQTKQQKDSRRYTYKNDNNDKNTTKAAETAAGEIPEIIDSFKEVNPAYRKWFSQPPQREACRRLLELHGKEKLIKVIKVLPKTNRTRFFPSIMTPMQLEDKWSSLEAQFVRKKAESEELPNKKGFI